MATLWRMFVALVNFVGRQFEPPDWAGRRRTMRWARHRISEIEDEMASDVALKREILRYQQEQQAQVPPEARK